MKKLLFLTSLLFAEEVSIAAKYPLIYEAMQTEQGANNLVGITEFNYEFKTKDMKENIFMQPAKNIIWFNDYLPWNPIFVVKIANHYVPFFKKFSLVPYCMIMLFPISNALSSKTEHDIVETMIFFTFISFIFHVIESVATTYYNITPVNTEEQLLKTINYNSTKALSITFFTINIILVIILIIANLSILYQ